MFCRYASPLRVFLDFQLFEIELARNCRADRQEVRTKTKRPPVISSAIFLTVAPVVPVCGPIIGGSRTTLVGTPLLGYPLAFSGWRAIAITSAKLRGLAIATRFTESARAIRHLKVFHRIAGLRILRNATWLAIRTFSADAHKWRHV